VNRLTFQVNGMIASSRMPLEEPAQACCAGFAEKLVLLEDGGVEFFPVVDVVQVDGIAEGAGVVGDAAGG
jgi:hypothetical protein